MYYTEFLTVHLFAVSIVAWVSLSGFAEAYFVFSKTLPSTEWIQRWFSKQAKSLFPLISVSLCMLVVISRCAIYSYMASWVSYYCQGLVAIFFFYRSTPFSIPFSIPPFHSISSPEIRDTQAFHRCSFISCDS